MDDEAATMPASVPEPPARLPLALLLPPTFGMTLLMTSASDAIRLDRAKYPTIATQLNIPLKYIKASDDKSKCIDCIDALIRQ